MHEFDLDSYTIRRVGVPPARAEPKLPRPQGKDDGIVSLDGRKKEKQPEEESGSVDNDTNAFDIGGRTSIRVGPAGKEHGDSNCLFFFHSKFKSRK